jgi:RHS repeat-associated protein
VSYLTNDHLGSPRIYTDQNGAVIARHDYHPFGEEIVGIGNRTAELGYASDSIRKQFTGYQRDNEIGLDFAQARYYNNQHGRFTSVDPIIMTPERLSDPQQINLYVYVRNNPLMFSDPTGEDLNGRTDGQDNLTEEDRKRLERQLRRLAPGTRVNADGTVRRPGFWQRVANRLTGHGVGTELVSNLVLSERTTTVVVGTGQDSGTGGDVSAIRAGTPTDAEVYWNYNQTSSLAI